MEEKKVIVSILQMCSKIGDIEANCSKVEDLFNQYFECNTADVVVLPEVWSCGWSCSHFRDTAQVIESSSVIDLLSRLAKKFNVNIIGGSFITKNGERYFNTCPVINRLGQLVATYSKNHLYSYYGCDEGKFVSVGDSPVMVELDGIKYGLTICYDIRFPEIYRAYRKAGVDILVNCAAWGSKKPIPWEVMTKSRAVENQSFMIALTQSGYIENGEYNLGESRIIDYKGEEVASIMSGEGVVSAEIDLAEMYDFREKCTVLNDIREDYEVKVLCTKY